MLSSTAVRTVRNDRKGGARLLASRAGAAILVLLLSALLPAPARAGEPTEQLRGAIDDVIQTLSKPTTPSKKAERRAILRKEISQAFDFEEMGKRSLGPAWRNRTPKERQEYLDLFTQLLEASYLGKIESYKGEKVRYVKETVDEGRYATVGTVVVTPSGEDVPIQYRLLKEGTRWRVYDVVIEGISLVNNYRSQFGSVLQRSSFADLLARMRTMIRQKA